MTAGSRSSPAMTRAGSPGRRCCSEKIRIDTKMSVGTNCTMRRARKFSMRALASRACRLVWAPSFELQSDHAHQPIRHRPVALELLAVGDQERPVIDVDDG